MNDTARTAVLAIAGLVLGLMVVETVEDGFFLRRYHVLAMMVGAVFGALWARIIGLERRLRDLRDADQPLQRESAAPSVPTHRPPSVPSKSPTLSGNHESAPSRERTRPSPKPASQAAREPQVSGRFRRWLSDGNLPVRIGVLVLFIGVAALLRLASERGWFNAPIEVRLLGIALAALAALVFAWRQRERRRVFSLSLQGGAIGVLALTVFAAFRLHDVLPASAAFALMVVLTAATGVLAVRQSALALAMLAVVAGFAAPILVATGQGNHVALFTWYALLNAAIFGIARYSHWPLLNRIGFAFTFVIATVWGVLRYRPEDFATVQPFLMVFFAIYFLIPIVDALREHSGKARLDAVLVFGLPLFAFPLQAAVLNGERLLIAVAAVVLAAIYLVSAGWLIRNRGLTTLGRSHAVLAAGFATLAVPFAFSHTTVTLIWALEGAALVWFGLYQDHRLGRLGGLALQAAAGLIWVVTLSAGQGISILNGFYLSGLALTAGFFISAWRYHDAGASAWLVNLLAALSVASWSLAGLLEVQRHAPALLQADTYLILAAMTALLTAMAHQFRAWPVTALAAAAALGAGMVLVPAQSETHQWPLGGWGAPVWALFIAAAVAVQHHMVDADSKWRALAAIAAHGAVLLMAAVSLAWLAEQPLELGNGWIWLAALVPVLALAGVIRARARAPLMIDALPASAQRAFEIFTVCALTLGLGLSLTSTGGAQPLPWVPLLNPLELAQLLGLALLFALMARIGGHRLHGWVGALAFIVLTAMVLRSCHHLAGVAWSLSALYDSPVTQAAVSVCWTAMAVVCWVAGSRRGDRRLWQAGAVLLGVVLVKLVIIDRGFLSSVAGIVSFLAFGLLAILIGFLAPAPPNREPGRESP